jgi:hypothetical protein
MRLRGFVLAAAVLLPTSAFADPITIAGSTWSSPGTEGGSSAGSGLDAFWDGLSSDGTTAGIGYLIGVYETEGIEYLHNGSGGAVPFLFAMDGISDPAYLGSITAWTGSTFGRRADGAFTYDSGTGHVSNSWDNPDQYALFRIVGPETTRYFLGIEDVLIGFPMNDHDHNDYIVTFSETHSIPEPSSLLLMGCAIAAAGLRKARNMRKERAARVA